MMLKLIVLFCVAGVITADKFDVNENTNAADLWESYKTEYNRNYDQNEDKVRFDLFKASVDRFREHNAKYARGEVSFFLGINSLSDMKEHELQKLRGGLNHSPPVYQ